MRKMLNKKGFTLAELLIVVAIIAVLVAIAIPVFTSQLEKSREATDAANIRNNYAEIIVGILNDQANYTIPTALATVDFKQSQAGWQASDVGESLDALKATHSTTNGDLDVEVTGTPTAGGKATFAYTAGTASANPKLTITIA